MQNKENTTLDYFKDLIRTSCQFCNRPAAQFEKFHEIFLKFFFGALDVKIDYDNKTIVVWNAKPASEADFHLLENPEAFSNNITYSNLEETLIGCVEEGVFQERFYRHLLLEYSPNYKNNSNSNSA